MPLTVNNLSYTYDPKTDMAHEALHNITLTIEKGETLALIGHTGSGKSTLVQLMSSLIKLQTGSVEADGRVGIVFQYPEQQLFESTIYRDVAFGPRNMGLPEEEVDARVQDALQMVGISREMFEKSPQDLSGGQKRRVALAGILAMQPDYLILDEPTAGLDPEGAEEIIKAVKAQQKKYGNALIIVSHDMDAVGKFATRVLVLANGRLWADEEPHRLFRRDEELQTIGLCAPTVTKIANHLKERGKLEFDLPPVSPKEFVRLIQK